jgi:hypothetical protein
MNNGFQYSHNQKKETALCLPSTLQTGRLTTTAEEKLEELLSSTISCNLGLLISEWLLQLPRHRHVEFPLMHLELLFSSGHVDKIIRPSKLIEYLNGKSLVVKRNPVVAAHDSVLKSTQSVSD